MDHSEELERRFSAGEGGNVLELLHLIMKQSIEDNNESRRYFLQKLQEYNKLSGALRGYLTDLNAFQDTVRAAAHERGIDFCRRDEESRTTLAELFEEYRYSYERDQIGAFLCLPDTVPAGGVDGFEALSVEIARLEEQLKETRDVSSMWQIRLQDAMQRQQELLQLMSNLLRAWHDSSLAIIKNMKA